MSTTNRVRVHLLTPHKRQKEFIESTAKRKVIRAGRRGGKTTGIAIYAVQMFLAGHRVLYAGPTDDQTSTFWRRVKQFLQEPIDEKVFYKNETLRVIEVEGTEQRIRAKTAWNADTLRGDYADVLILDEFQMMNEDTWGVVGAPMLLDNNGDAVFIYTPPSLRNRSASKANDPQHAPKLFRRAKRDKTGRWAAFHFSSLENPYISQEALSDITEDITDLAYRMEILAEDVEESPGALWKRADLETLRVREAPEFEEIVVGVDPSVTSMGDEAGIVVDGRAARSLYTLDDRTVQGSPHEWATAAVNAYHFWNADWIIAESNQGGEMVALTIKQIDPTVPVKLVFASRGKRTRAEPISAIYQNKRAHHVGSFPALEDEMCLWVPGDPSPNRMDAHVWAATHLMLGKTSKLERSENPFYD